MSGIQIPGNEIRQAVVVSDQRLLMISGYAVLEDPESGNLLLVFDTHVGEAKATRVSIPFGRIQFAEFARKISAAIPSNGGDDEGLRVLQ